MNYSKPGVYRNHWGKKAQRRPAAAAARSCNNGVECQSSFTIIIISGPTWRRHPSMTYARWAERNNPVSVPSASLRIPLVRRSPRALSLVGSARSDYRIFRRASGTGQSLTLKVKLHACTAGDCPRRIGQLKMCVIFAADRSFVEFTAQWIHLINSRNCTLTSTFTYFVHFEWIVVVTMT